MNRLKITLVIVALGFLARSNDTLPQTARSTVLPPGTTTRVYVTNSKGDDVTVIDPASMKVVGVIKTGANPHGVIASPDRRTLYISVEGTDELIAVDTATHAVKGG
jgi:YVTN family beta-propeller protein